MKALAAGYCGLVWWLIVGHLGAFIVAGAGAWLLLHLLGIERVTDGGTKTAERLDSVHDGR